MKSSRWNATVINRPRAILQGRESHLYNQVHDFNLTHHPMMRTSRVNPEVQSEEINNVNPLLEVTSENKSRGNVNIFGGYGYSEMQSTLLDRAKSLLKPLHADSRMAILGCVSSPRKAHEIILWR